MAESKHHYNNLLGPVYSWMTGDFDENIERALDEIKELKISENDLVLDLGAGHGIYSVALAKLGAKVIAYENCDSLVNELRRNAEGKSIDVRAENMLAISVEDESEVESVICMTDTILHLESQSDVENLLRSILSVLKKNGHLLLSIRNYNHAPENRKLCLIPRQDESRIHTCLLNYLDNEIEVTDIIHEKAEGSWNVRQSSYQKLRISPELLANKITEVGFSKVNIESKMGMFHILAIK